MLLLLLVPLNARTSARSVNDSLISCQ